MTSFVGKPKCEVSSTKEKEVGGREVANSESGSGEIKECGPR